MTWRTILSWEETGWRTYDEFFQSAMVGDIWERRPVDGTGPSIFMRVQIQNDDMHSFSISLSGSVEEARKVCPLTWVFYEDYPPDRDSFYYRYVE